MILLLALLGLFQYSIPRVTGGALGPVPVPTTKTCTNYAATGTTVTCTFSANPAAGERVFVGVWEVGSGTLSVTDSSSNTYTAVAALHTATTVTPISTQLFYSPMLTGSISTITVTQAGGSSSGTLIDADTATGIAASSPVDGSICYADTVSSTTIPCGTAITTTVANDYLFCDAHNGTGGDSFSAGAGFTAGASFNANHLAQYGVFASVGAITPSITSSLGDAATMSCAAFKP